MAQTFNAQFSSEMTCVKRTSHLTCMSAINGKLRAHGNMYKRMYNITVLIFDLKFIDNYFFFFFTFLFLFIYFIFLGSKGYIILLLLQALVLCRPVARIDGESEPFGPQKLTFLT